MQKIVQRKGRKEDQTRERKSGRREEDRKTDKERERFVDASQQRHGEVLCERMLRAWTEEGVLRRHGPARDREIPKILPRGREEEDEEEERGTYRGRRASY